MGQHMLINMGGSSETRQHRVPFPQADTPIRQLQLSLSDQEGFANTQADPEQKIGWE